MCKAGMGTPYWYEWEIGLLKCLEMLYDENIRSVVFQDPRFSSIDDVVINYNDGSTLNIQVKHTDVDNNFTFSTLLSGDNPMLVKWAKDWEKNKANINIKSINIITNKKFGTNVTDGLCSFKNFLEIVLPQWQKDVNYSSKKSEENAAIDIIKMKLNFLGDDVFNFIKLLKFGGSDGREELGTKFKDYIAQILGTKNDNIVNQVAKNLYANLRIWTTSLREKTEVEREDIYSALCSEQSYIPQFELLYPERPIFPSRERFKEVFIDFIKKSESKIIFLRGLPGSGKTNFISYLSKTEQSIVDFYFYTYLPAKKGEMFFSDDAGYYSGNHLWKCLLHQLKEKFKDEGLLYELRFPLNYSYMSLPEMRNTVLKYLDIYAKKQGRTCYVFIDGIDHAARSRMPANDIFLNQIPAVEQINGNVKFILIGQPTNGKYPSWLMNKKGMVDIDLPTLANDDVLMLLEEKDINVSGANLDGLANKILQVVGNNALNVLFAIEECKCNDYDYDELINALTERKLDCEISKYYEWILNSLDSSLVLDKLIAIFSYATQKLSKVELSKLCNADVTEVGNYLGTLYPLVQEDEEGFYIFHNDVRLYFKDYICNNRNYNTLVESFTININKDESLSQLKYRYLFDALYDISWKKAIEIYNPEYIIKSTLFDVPVMKLVEQFDLLFVNAYKEKSINDIIKLNLCFNALFQYVNCLEYNNLIDVRFKEQNEDPVKSEKYILDCNNDLEKIIDDIYVLTSKELYSRGEKLFKEYFGKFENKQFATIVNNSKYETRLNKLGYIFRYYRQDGVLNSITDNENLYSKISSGWLKASQKFLETSDVRVSLSIWTCYNTDLYNYVNSIVLELEYEALKILGDFLSDNNASIFTLIDICCALKVKGYNETSLIDVILQKKDEIITDDTLEISKNKISYFFKMCFCILDKIDENNKSELVKLHENLLRDNHIEKEDRGYEAEYKLMEIANKIYKAYKNKIILKDFGKIIYDMTYFADKYGVGAAHAINSFDTIRFLEQIINLLYKEISDEDSRKVACEQLMPIFIGANNIPANFKKEYISLFRMSNKIEYLKTIAEYWVGKNGAVWGQDYASVEDVSGALLEELKLCDMVDYADKINKIKSEKIIGYVGHKDYSLYDVLDWFDIMPLSENKFLYGINLLSISDEANNIGDNRASNSIEDAVFEVAIRLGWKYVDALFEIHNTVEKFYDWRILLLNVLIDSLDYIKYTDDELIEIHKLLNSWIKKDIEIKKTYGSNQMEFLADSNHKIAEKIENQNMRNEYLQIYPKVNKEQDTHDYSRLGDGVKSEMEDNIKAIVTQEGLSGLAMGLLEKYIEKDFSSTYLFLAEIGRDLCQEDRDKYIKRFILPYIIEKNKYGMRGRGLDYLLNEFIGSISVEQYLDILYHAVSRLKNNEPEEFFGINEDFNIITMRIVKAYYPNNIAKVLSQKINMHQLWITACGDMQLEYYNVSFDKYVSTIVDFNKKHLGNI